MIWDPERLRTKYLPANRWPTAAGPAPGWLAPVECAELARLKDPTRRSAWLAGRWCAKLLIRQAIDELRRDNPPGRWTERRPACGALAEIEIRSRDEFGHGIRPRITVHGEALSWSISISHSVRGALAALASTDACVLGVDLTDPTPPTAGFLRLWFTATERRWIEPDPPRRAAMIWSLKEAVYKACQEGENWSPREVEIRPSPRGGFRGAFRGRALRASRIETFEIDGQIAALVCRERLLDGVLLRMLAIYGTTP